MTNTSQISHVRIPGYTILKEIGRGGVATVYLAIQESLEREVALKIMSPALAAEPNFTERFIREGRTIAQLTHPGIVTIYDISVADYQHYIAMEYLGSGSLKQRMQKPIAPAPALSVLRQVAGALGYAHSKGFVHRDVKPENIIFRDPNKPVLTDFGIAKQTTDSETHLTSVGVIVGTPRYMSPEQADGRGTDPRSDIYALGILLYEMLAGRPPFDAKESIALLYSHINDPIPTLPDRLSFLQSLVNDLLAKDPEQRVQNCEALVERLRRAQQDVRDGDNQERILTPPSSANTKARSTPVTARRKRDGVWHIATWTGVALALTFLVMAAARYLLHDDVADDTTGPTTAVNAPPPSSRVVDTPAVPEPATPPPVPQPDIAQPEMATPEILEPEKVTVKDVPAPVAKQPAVPAARNVEPPAVKASPPPSTRQALSEAPKQVTREAPKKVEPKPAAVATSTDVVKPEVVEVVKPKRTTPSPVTSVTVAPATRARKPAQQTSRTMTPRSAKPDGTKPQVARGWVLANDKNVEELLARAQQQLEQERLSHPPGDNALETYQEVLKSAPDNVQAKQGLQRIAAQYLRLAKQAFAQNKFSNTEAYLERGLTAVPDDAELQALKITVDNRIRADKDFAEAEKYYYGRGVNRDLERAAKLYQSAADKGHIIAQYRLAVIYGNGRGVERDEREALRWLQVAAAQGNFDAQYNLGLGLLFGSKPDPRTAAKWIKQLAELNYKPAYRLLGWMYTTATGVEHSITSSARWVAKGVISNPVGPPLKPDWVVNEWQRKFDQAFERDVNKPIDDAS